MTSPLFRAADFSVGWPRLLASGPSESLLAQILRADTSPTIPTSVSTLESVAEVLLRCKPELAKRLRRAIDAAFAKRALDA